jgi:hypothetical protein
MIMHSWLLISQEDELEEYFFISLNLIIFVFF